jgi:NTP pyrophosphatase (non-canonical NTP hydrolase)
LIDRIIKAATDELERAKKKHPTFPHDIVHALSIMSEESGEATQAVNQYYYEDGKKSDVAKEVIQTMATCIRFLENYETYLEPKDDR